MVQHRNIDSYGPETVLTNNTGSHNMFDFYNHLLRIHLYCHSCISGCQEDDVVRNSGNV